MGNFQIKDTVTIAGLTTSGVGNTNQPTTYLKSGETPYVFYLPTFQGVDNEGKQKISTDKRYIDPSPRFTYGITNNFRLQLLAAVGWLATKRALVRQDH